jgi:hypothetical protein
MAVMGDREGLRELRDLLSAVPELRAWIPAANEPDRDAELAEGIQRVVVAKPGLRQVDLKGHLGVPDARRLSTLSLDINPDSLPEHRLVNYPDAIPPGLRGLS